MRENCDMKSDGRKVGGKKRRKYCRVLCVICGWCVVTVKDVSNTTSCLLAPYFSTFIPKHLFSVIYHLFIPPSINEGTWIVKGAEASISQRSHEPKFLLRFLSVSSRSLYLPFPPIVISPLSFYCRSFPSNLLWAASTVCSIPSSLLIVAGKSII